MILPVELSAVLGLTLLNRMWYSLPLIVAISFVYAGTRHEVCRPILEHAVRFAFWIVSFMLVVFLVLALVSSWL